MNHYFFIENNSGEQFIVGADTWDEAIIAAEDVAAQCDNNPDLLFGSILTDEEAEASGLDEY